MYTGMKNVKFVLWLMIVSFFVKIFFYHIEWKIRHF